MDIIETMLQAMTEASGYTREQLLGSARGGIHLCPCRYFIWYHLHKDRKWSENKIGKAFGRNHSTIHTGMSKVDGILETPCYKVEQKIYDEFINNLIEKI